MKRSPGIDFLRGLCILAVVLHHINLRLHYGKLLPNAFNQVLFWSGSQAVKVFFVISGFLITSTIVNRWGTVSNIDIPRFYRLRFARIAPCLLALVAILSAFHLLHLNGFIINPTRASLPRAIAAALTLHVNWLEAHVGYLPGPWDILWSLSVEEAFYLVYPLLCRYARPRWTLPATAAALIFIGPFFRTVFAANAIAEDYAWLANMDCISIGCIATLIARRQNRLALRIAGSALVLLVIVFRTPAAWLGLSKTGLDVTVLALGTAMLLMSIGDIPFTSLIRWFGRNSYEVYLTHMFIVTWGTQLFANTHAGLQWAPLWFIGMVAVAGILGAIVSRYFSEPMNRRLRSTNTQANAVGH